MEGVGTVQEGGGGGDGRLCYREGYGVLCKASFSLTLPIQLPSPALYKYMYIHVCKCTVYMYLPTSPSFPPISPPSLSLPPSPPPSGAIYLKNCVYKYWRDREGVVEVGEEPPYSIPEEAKVFIRGNIVAGIIQSPTLIW